MNNSIGSWLLLAVGENRAFGSNDGYQDEPEAHYAWDSTVPNHARLAPGDAVVLWDKHTSIGMSVIESIESRPATKTVYSCPSCGMAHIKARRTKTPRYKCFRCHAEFEVPSSELKQVTKYTSSHANAWVDLAGLLSGAQLRVACYSPKSQLSMRPLDWELFKASAADAHVPEILTVIEAASAMIIGGHQTRNVRVRLGQAAFRRALIGRQGPVCAFTGAAPVPTLEAAHLYSYAKVGEHHQHGGLLMRRDLHRLFDLGLISVNPASLTISVAGSLASYPLYAELDGQTLAVTVTRAQTEWLQEHWNEHRVENAQVQPIS